MFQLGRMATYSDREIQWKDAVECGGALFPYDQVVVRNQPVGDAWPGRNLRTRRRDPRLVQPVSVKTQHYV